MQLIVDRSGHRFYFQRITEPSGWQNGGITAPFGCMLWDSRLEMLASDHGDLVMKLLAAGCATLVCGGAGAESWHDAADEQVALLTATTTPDLFVMTTWHTNESMAEVAQYFTLQANVDDRNIRTHLVLLLGSVADIASELVAAVRDEVEKPDWDVSGSNAV
jgi:hypothetical protein